MGAAQTEAASAPASLYPAGPGGLAAAVAEGYAECRVGASRWRIAHLLGSAELRRRYARSRLGQFWVTLSTLVSVVALGSVWTVLWQQPVDEMLPYIAVSLVIWAFISSFVADGMSIFIANAHYMLNQGLPVSVFVYGFVWRNFLIFAHNAVIVLLTTLIFGTLTFSGAAEFLLALVLTLITGFFTAFIVAMACLRYRDLIQVVSSVMQIAFYLTPVLWRPEFMKVDFAPALIAFNPFAIFLSIMRDPLLGRAVEAETWIAAASITAAVAAASLALIGLWRRRIIYWV